MFGLLRLALALAVFCAPAQGAQRLAAPVLLRSRPAAVAVAPSLVLTSPAALPVLEVPAAVAATLPGLSAPAVSALEQAGAASLQDLPVAGRAFDGTAKFAAAAVAVPLVAEASAVAPLIGAIGYSVGNALAFAFPFPETYKAYSRGHADGFPLARAALGASGTLALGAVNAPVLDKPLWGVLHIFVALGMLAPYFVGRALKRRGRTYGSYQALAAASEMSRSRRLWHRLKNDSALLRSFAAGALMLAASLALYTAAAAVVPGYMTANFSQPSIDNTLFWIQLLKGLFFVGVFAPDAAALLRGKPARGFSLPFTSIFLLSVASFSLWGFQQAFISEPGPIQNQYLVLALRNAGEAAVAFLSWLAIRRQPRHG